MPTWLFYWGAAIVLVVSFVLLGALWKRPVLERRAGGRELPGWLQALVLSKALRIALQAVSVTLLVLLFATAFLGSRVVLLNLAPIFVYVAFWLGLPLLSVTLGNVWTVLSPWRAIADVVVWAIEWVGYEAKPVLGGAEGLGRYPAAAALFAFVSLELAHPRFLETESCLEVATREDANVAEPESHLQRHEQQDAESDERAQRVQRSSSLRPR